MQISDIFDLSTFDVRLSVLAWDCRMFPDFGPYLRHFDRNIHEKYVDLILYRQLFRRPAE